MKTLISNLDIRLWLIVTAMSGIIFISMLPSTREAVILTFSYSVGILLGGILLPKEKD